MTELKVIPEYGFGWFMDGSFIEEPPPFMLRILETTTRGNGCKAILGVVVDAGHRLAGMQVLLSQRTLGDGQATYTVYANSVLPSLKELEERNEPPVAQATGFAVLDKGAG